MPSRRAARPAPLGTGATSAEPGPGAPARAHAWRGFLHPRWSQLLVLGLVALLVASAIWQGRARAEDATYTNLRRADLVELLDQLTTEQRRLESEVGQLESSRRELQSGADKQAIAQAEAAKRLDTASVLAGTVPVSGAGITVTVLDPDKKVTAQMLVDAFAELRDAGAEAIEVNAHRVVANTYVGGAPGALTLSGEALDLPVTIRAIGDARTLEEGLRFRGGIVSQVTSRGGSVAISQSPRVDIASVVQPVAAKHAEPVR